MSVIVILSGSLCPSVVLCVTVCVRQYYCVWQSVSVSIVCDCLCPLVLCVAVCVRQYCVWQSVSVSIVCGCLCPSVLCVAVCVRQYCVWLSVSVSIVCGCLCPSVLCVAVCVRQYCVWQSVSVSIVCGCLCPSVLLCLAVACPPQVWLLKCHKPSYEMTSGDATSNLHHLHNVIHTNASLGGLQIEISLMNYSIPSRHSIASKL